MKIVHICLSCFYIDNYSYQENELVAQNVKDGHDVVVVASTETFGVDRRLAYVNPGEYMGSDGVRVMRIPYSKFLPEKIMRKLRIHPGLYKILEKENPDVIMFHGLCGWELLTAARYKSKHSAVILYADSHEDLNNSARGFISKYILHYIYYRSILKMALRRIEKILCISQDVIVFVRDFYGVPSDRIEFYPLGGEVLSDECYGEIRRNTRNHYGIKDEQVLFVQSGKIDKIKKLIESLQEFKKIEGDRYRFLISGSLQEDVRQDVLKLVSEDQRVSFIGWKSPKELQALLCAADVYVQPGSQSATMQMSICCRCAVILDDVLSHQPFVNGNGWLVGKNMSLDEAFLEASSCSREKLSDMDNKSADIAESVLDYKLLAKRIYQ
jgi:glycosyltransferase involved in cell wall biosynthesis